MPRSLTKRTGKKKLSVSDGELLGMLRDPRYLTMTEVGKAVGVSRQRIKQIYEKRLRPITGKSYREIKQVKRKEARKYNVLSAIPASGYALVAGERAADHGLEVRAVAIGPRTSTVPRTSRKMLYIEDKLCLVTGSSWCGNTNQHAYVQYYGIRIPVKRRKYQFFIILTPDTTFIIPRDTIVSCGLRYAYIPDGGPTRHDGHPIERGVVPTVNWWEYAERWDLLMEE